MLRKDFENPFVDGLSSQATKRYKAMSPEMIVAEVLRGKDDMEGMYYLLTVRYKNLMVKKFLKVWPQGSLKDSLDDMIHEFWFYLYGTEEPHWGKLRQLKSLKAFGSWLSTTSFRYFLHELKKEESRREKLSEWVVTDVYADDPEERAAEEELDRLTLKKAAEIMAAIPFIQNPEEQFALSAKIQEKSTEYIMAVLTAMRREKDPTANEVSRDYVYVLQKRAKEKITEIINHENIL